MARPRPLPPARVSRLPPRASASALCDRDAWAIVGDDDLDRDARFLAAMVTCRPAKRLAFSARFPIVSERSASQGHHQSVGSIDGEGNLPASRCPLRTFTTRPATLRKFASCAAAVARTPLRTRASSRSTWRRNVSAQFRRSGRQSHVRLSHEAHDVCGKHLERGLQAVGENRRLEPGPRALAPARRAVVDLIGERPHLAGHIHRQPSSPPLNECL